MISEITVLIKTFKRPAVCKRLIDSIRKFYPDIKIFVAVDDESGLNFEQIDKQIDLPFNSGLSKGRNEMVNVCETPYCLILDDDCIFTEKTKLEALLKEIKDRDLDILQPEIPNTSYHGLFEVDRGHVKSVKGDRDGLYDIVLNIFLAKTETLKKYQWDNDLKMGEHFIYFFTYRGKMRIGITDICEIEHKHESNPDYDTFRYTARKYIKEWLNKNGFNTITNVHGEVHRAVNL